MGQGENPLCILTYTNGRNVDHVVIVNRETAETMLDLIEQPRGARVETAGRLDQVVNYLKLSGKIGSMSLKVGVQSRNVKTGLIEAVKRPLMVRDVLFLSKCLRDERDSAFEVMSRGLRRFIADGSVRVLHPFREAEVPKKIVI